LKKEKEKEEKEDENFQLLYYLSYMVKSASVDTPILGHYKYANDSPPR
jgi:hypothetical protein